MAEDKRFFQHGGSDWIARFYAMWQNIQALRVLRGASTISEQTARILYPRKCTVLSHWLEGIEATILEKRVSKADNKTREILAWVNAGKFSSNQIDAVTTPRQPGSTLKPFLYALALILGQPHL